jgi:hypothetical protein
MLAKFGRVLPFIALVLAVVATSAQAPGPAQPAAPAVFWMPLLIELAAARE